MEAREPGRGRAASAKRDRPARHVAEPHTALLHHPPARQPATGVDTEHPQPLPSSRHAADSRSSSSAAMSMFEDTDWTSS